VQSIFGTEEENAKSKDKQVFNTMEEVAKPKEMTSAKEGIKPVVETSAKDFFSNKPMNEASLKDFVSQNPDFALNDFNKLEDEFETMVDYDGTNSMEVVSQLKEKYKGDATKQQALDKLEGKEKFRTAAKQYMEENSGTSPLWAKSGMTGSQKLWDANRVKDAMFDFINDEPTIEAALAQAKSVFQGSKYSEEFIKYLEQNILANKEKTKGASISDEERTRASQFEIEDALADAKAQGKSPKDVFSSLRKQYDKDGDEIGNMMLDKFETGYNQEQDMKGSSNKPMTSAKEGIKPVKNAEVVAEKYNNSLVRKGNAFDGLDEMGEKPMKKIPESEIAGIPEYTFEEAFGKSDATPLSYYSKDFKGKNEQYFVLKDNKGNKFFVDTEGYDYSRYYAPVDATKGATPVEGGKTVETEGIKPVDDGKPDTKRQTQAKLSQEISGLMNLGDKSGKDAMKELFETKYANDEKMKDALIQLFAEEKVYKSKRTYGTNSFVKYKDAEGLTQNYKENVARLKQELAQKPNDFDTLAELRKVEMQYQKSLKLINK
jgi:hypothetical protein